MEISPLIKKPQSNNQKTFSFFFEVNVTSNPNTHYTKRYNYYPCRQEWPE
jgi:hypothetical protein